MLGCNDAAIQAAGTTYVDKLLKGADASMTPIEQVGQIALTVNARTAKSLGLASIDRGPRGSNHRIGARDQEAAWTQSFPRRLLATNAPANDNPIGRRLRRRQNQPRWRA